MYLSLIVTFTSRLDVLIEIKVVQDAVHLLNSDHVRYSIHYNPFKCSPDSIHSFVFTSRVETL